MTLDFNDLTDEELIQWFNTNSPEKIISAVMDLPEEKISLIVSNLERQGTTDTATKIEAIVLGLETKKQIEAVGTVLNTEFSLLLISSSMKWKPDQVWKISSLLVGLEHRVFHHLLTKASEKQLEVIQHEALRESIQHHLTIFSHEMKLSLDKMTEEVENLGNKIDFLQPEEMTYEELKTITDEIELHLKQNLEATSKISRALGIAWNSNRPDIIEKLSDLKELAVRTKAIMIGNPRTQDSEPDGLYKQLENQLCSVFGPLNSPEALQDDEPAIEALAKLSVWYLKDYWSVGLLPSISSEEMLQMDPKRTSEKERNDHREHLLREVNETLRLIGLETVGDVKAAFIFSKEMLLAYIKQHYFSALSKSVKT